MGKTTARPACKGSSQVKGWFRANGQLISGWALDRADLARKVDVEIFVDGRSVGIARADRYDPVVQAENGGDGAHAFAFYFAASDAAWTEAEALAKEFGSAAELRSKNPRIVKSEEHALPLEVTDLSLTRIAGRAPGYPTLATATLEIWSGDERVLSQVPVRWDNKKDRRFSADLPPEAAGWIIAEGTEVALPGLKEAGLGAPIGLGVRAFVTKIDEDLFIEFRGDLPFQEAFEATVEFTHQARPGTSVAAVAKAGRVSCLWPDGMPLAGTSLTVSVGELSIPTVFERELELSDPNFATLSCTDRHLWHLSEGCSGERGFFAFPSELASERRLSGHFVHLWREIGEGAVQISQQLPNRFVTGDRLCKRALLRAGRGAKLCIRLVDDCGILGHVQSVARGEHHWVPLALEVEFSRASDGVVRFEIESIDAAGHELEIALGNSADGLRHVEPAEPRNLLTNGGLTNWPFGLAARRHTVRGEICDGWRIFNRKCQRPMFSRPTMDSSGASIGLAIAVPEVANYVRLEADLASTEVEVHDTVLSFLASVSPAARLLLSQSVEPTPTFTIIDRIYLLRRSRTTTAGEVMDKDEIVSAIARRTPVAAHGERHSFRIPKCGVPEPDEENSTTCTYHLVFEFRAPAVIELSDVVIARGALEIADVPDTPELEDRNILLQVPMLNGLEHWLSPVPNLPATRPVPGQRPLKWSSEASREMVEIIVPVHNALDETMGCLDSLSRSTSVPILVRIIDDGSDVAVADALDAYAWGKPWIHVHRLGSNRGYTFAADFGIRSAHSNWVVLLNSDTVTTEGWLEGMLACAYSDPRIAFVGPLSNAATYQSVPHVYDAAGKFKVNALPGSVSPDDVAKLVRRLSSRNYPDAPLLNGFCTLMKRSAFLEVGGLNHGAFPSGYGEENDLCIRIRKSGWRLAVADDVYVFHHKSASFGNARRTELSKLGSSALKKLHPDIDLQALTSWFKEMPSLNALREALARELDRRSAAGNHFAPDDPPAAEALNAVTIAA